MYTYDYSRRCFLPAPFELSIPAPLLRSSSWVQWAWRHTTNTCPECFYLVEEDGAIFEVSVTADQSGSCIPVGYFDCPLDTAFACVAQPQSDLREHPIEILIGGGSQSKIEVRFAPPSVQGHHKSLPLLQTLPCWSTIAHSEISTCSSSSEDSYKPGRIFVAHGQYPKGVISELKRELNARTHAAVELPNLPPIRNLWVIDSEWILNANGHAVYHCHILVSMVGCSCLLHTFADQSTGRSWQFEPAHKAWSFSICETLAASNVSSGWWVQITPAAIWVNHTLALAAQHFERFAPSTAILAAIAAPGPVVTAALVLREGMATCLHVMYIQGCAVQDVTRFVSLPPHSLPAYPSSLDVFSVGGEAIYCVGTSDHHILLFTVRNGHIILTAEATMRISGDDVPTTCEGAVLLTSSGRHMLVCGTRHGEVLAWEMNIPSDGLSDDSDFSNHAQQQSWMQYRRGFKMGDLPVRIVVCEADSSLAFVSCGESLCRLQFATSGPCLQMDAIQPLLPGRQAVVVCAFGPSTGKYSGLLLAAVESKLVLTEIDCHTRSNNLEATMKSRMDVNLTPNRMKYSRSSGAMIVALSAPKESAGPTGPTRTMESVLRLIQLDETNATVAEFQLRDHELVTSILECDFGSTHKRHIIVLGTSCPKGKSAPGARHEAGRRRFLEVRCDEDGKIQIHPLYGTDFPRPISGMDMSHRAADGCLHLFTAYGSSMLCEVHEGGESPETSWCFRARSQLAMDVQELTAVSDHCVVSTTKADSTLHVVERGQLTRRCSAYGANFTHAPTKPSWLCHLFCRMHSSDLSDQESTKALFLVAGSDGALMGVEHVFEEQTSTLLNPTFTAYLPGPITRLHRAPVRPVWRSPNLSHYHPGGTGRRLKGHDASKPTALDDAIGIAADGAVYSLLVVDSHQIEWLEIISLVALAKEKAMTKGEDFVPRVSHECSTASHWHLSLDDLSKHALKGRRYVDGDLLWQALQDAGGLQNLMFANTAKDVHAEFFRRAGWMAGAQQSQALHAEPLAGHVDGDLPRDVVDFIQELEDLLWGLLAPLL